MEESNTIIAKLDPEEDSKIIRQIVAIIFRYLEKRNRLKKKIGPIGAATPTGPAQPEPCSKTPIT